MALGYGSAGLRATLNWMAVNFNLSLPQKPLIGQAKYTFPVNLSVVDQSKIEFLL